MPDISEHKPELIRETNNREKPGIGLAIFRDTVGIHDHLEGLGNSVIFDVSWGLVASGLEVVVGHLDIEVFVGVEVFYVVFNERGHFVGDKNLGQ